MLPQSKAIKTTLIRSHLDLVHKRCRRIFVSTEQFYQDLRNLMVHYL